MGKIVKDVFKNVELQNAKILNSNLDEVKFSKKLNSAIIEVSSSDNISLYEIEKFEQQACDIYKLNSFKIEYKYLGQKIEVDNKKIQEILNEISCKYIYTLEAFRICNINIEENRIYITFYSKFADFLKQKQIDMYIKNSIETKYGTKYDIFLLDDSSVKNVDENKDHLNMVKIEDLVKKHVNVEASNEIKPSENTNIQETKQQRPAFQRMPLSEEEKRIKDLKDPQPENVILGRDITEDTVIKISDVNEEQELACVDGQIFSSDVRETKSGKMLITLNMTDKTDTISCKAFLNKDKYDAIKGRIKDGKYVKLQGRPQFDTYSNDLTIMITSIIESKAPKEKVDDAEEKRVELHVHTQMSAMDAVSSATDIVKRAIKWGHRAVAITDHGVAQSFPEANHVITDNYEKLAIEKTGKKRVSTQDILDNAPIKVLYGVEGYLVDDIMVNPKFSDTYCVFDTETTGFDPRKNDMLTEIAICKVKNGEIIDEFTTFINPERNIPKEVQELTHITEEMVKDAPTIEEVFPKILDFFGDSILVAHNADFDINFLQFFAEKLGYSERFNNLIIDTLMIAREIYYYLPNKKLGTIVEDLGIELEGAHRAINDTRATAKMFIRMCEDLEKRNIDVNNYAHSEKNVAEVMAEKAYHIIIFAKNYVGLKNLYKIISYSHLHYFKKKPKIFKSMLNRYKEGLLLGSACEQGELYQAILNKKSEEEILEIASYYDYMEIQPLGNNAFYERGAKIKNKNYVKGVDEKEKEYDILKLTHQELIDINNKIVEVGDKLGKLTVATCDVHFLNAEDEIYRRILQAGQGYDDADMQAPLYFRTTNEMLAEFEYLGDRAYEIVVTNTNKVADMCDTISPISDEKCPPHIEGCEQDIRNIAMDKAHKLYGDPLPEIVSTRLEKELNSIISNGYSVMYIIAQKLVWDSNDHGYIVGSRGSVGSSLAAYMTGITEVNSLKAHYRCPNCKYSDFSDHGFKNGFDLPDMDCPKCGHKLDKDGMDIPFETFLGFNGDKEPDIDLNFSRRISSRST